MKMKLKRIFLNCLILFFGTIGKGTIEIGGFFIKISTFFIKEAIKMYDKNEKN